MVYVSLLDRPTTASATKEPAPKSDLPQAPKKLTPSKKALPPFQRALTKPPAKTHSPITTAKKADQLQTQPSAAPSAPMVVQQEIPEEPKQDVALLGPEIQAAAQALHPLEQNISLSPETTGDFAALMTEEPKQQECAPLTPLKNVPPVPFLPQTPLESVRIDTESTLPTAAAIESSLKPKTVHKAFKEENALADETKVEGSRTKDALRPNGMDPVFRNDPSQEDPAEDLLTLESDENESLTEGTPSVIKKASSIPSNEKLKTLLKKDSSGPQNTAIVDKETQQSSAFQGSVEGKAPSTLSGAFQTAKTFQNAHTPATAYSTPTEQIAVSIKNSLGSGASGKTQIDLQLRPDSLGRVNIKLDINQEGQTIVVVATERQDSRDMLQQDSRQLTALLQESGLEIHPEDIAYNLFDHSPPDHDQHGQNEESPHNNRAPQEDLSGPPPLLSASLLGIQEALTPRHGGLYDAHS